MKNLKVTLVAEIMKLRRSGILVITVCLFVFIPLMMGLLMLLAQHPEISAKLGLMAAKASFFSENSWKGYFEILNQTIAAIGVIGFGFVTSWVFGREYIEHTITDILALPVTRSSIVISKFVTVIIWCSLLILILYVSGVIIGLLINIPGWSVKLFYQSLYIYFVTSYLTVILCTPVAFITSVSRGLIAPLGFVILSLIMANFIAVIGLGPYFPWAIPGIFSIGPGTESMQLYTGSYIILGITGIIGFIGTILWWRYADQH